jgi:acetyl esterase/lipase
VVLVGDSAGGGLALAVALTLRDRGGPQPSHLLLVSPWVDLTTSTPRPRGDRDRPVAVHRQDARVRRVVGRLADEVGRPEVSPGSATWPGCRRRLMFFGTRDSLWPGGQAAGPPGRGGGWPLTYVEEPG